MAPKLRQFSDDEIRTFRDEMTKQGFVSYETMTKDEVVESMRSRKWKPKEQPERVIVPKVKLIEMSTNADYDSIFKNPKSVGVVFGLCAILGVKVEADKYEKKMDLRFVEAKENLVKFIKDRLISEGQQQTPSGKSSSSGCGQPVLQQPEPTTAEEEEESEEESSGEGDSPVESEEDGDGVVNVQVSVPTAHGPNRTLTFRLPRGDTIAEIKQYIIELPSFQHLSEDEFSLTFNNKSQKATTPIANLLDDGSNDLHLGLRVKARGGAPKAINLEEWRESIRNAFTPDQQRAMDAEFRTLMAAEQLQATIARSDRLDSVITRQAEGTLMSTSQYPRRTVIRGNATSHPAWLEGASIASLAKCNLPTLLTLARSMNIVVAVEFDVRRNVWLKPKRDRVAELVFTHCLTAPAGTPPTPQLLADDTNTADASSSSQQVQVDAIHDEDDDDEDDDDDDDDDGDDETQQG